MSHQPQTIAFRDAAQALAHFQASCGAAFLATMDGQQPRVRPVSPVAVEGTVVWIATFAASAKVPQLQSNPRAELCFMSDDHAQLRLEGRCEFVADPAVKQRMWQSYPLMQRYFPQADHPQYVLLKFVTSAAQAMPAMALQYEPLPLSCV